MPRQRSLRKHVLVVFTAWAVSACSSTQSNVSVDYYRISGNSTADLDREIERKGPKTASGRHAVAVARIRIIPNIAYGPTVGGCIVSRAKVAVKARVTLPTWTGRARAGRKLGKAWDNIDRYTRMHEAVHVAIAFRFARELETALIALPPQGDCKQANRLATVLIQKTLEQHDRTQKQFDADEQRRFAQFLKR